MPVMRREGRRHEVHAARRALPRRMLNKEGVSKDEFVFLEARARGLGAARPRIGSS